MNEYIWMIPAFGGFTITCAIGIYFFFHSVQHEQSRWGKL